VLEVVALAGRRVDPDAAETARFPARQVPHVRARIREFLAERKARIMVCSGACGADLLALESAGELGLRRRVVLPFAPERFRATSVVDRPGAWGDLYDEVIRSVRAAGDLVVLDTNASDDESYAAAARAILDEAQALAGAGASPRPIAAVVVWDGRSRGSGDLTLGFADEARRRGIPLFEILTLS
jgi:hypothetical protein